MFRLLSVKIEDFWGRLNVSCSFNEDVNIIIGRNGTGKTTFTNVLHSALALELESLNENSFDNVTIKIKEGSRTKTVKVVSKFDITKASSTLEYTISRKKYVIRSFEDHRLPVYMKRRYQEDVEKLKLELDKLIALSSLSVYRLRSGEDFEIRDKYSSELISPVDYRLEQLLQNLTKYQLYLSQRARDVSTKLQKEVLASIFYSKGGGIDDIFNFSFDKEKKRRNLIAAYSQLGAFDSDVRKKINFRVESIANTFEELRLAEKNNRNILNVDYRSFEASRKTQRVIKMSLGSEEEVENIFLPTNLFLETLHEFITDKKFNFIPGELIIEDERGPISRGSLSSGEKQLLTLFIETLLQQNKPFIYLTDELELPLHIA